MRMITSAKSKRGENEYYKKKGESIYINTYTTF